MRRLPNNATPRQRAQALTQLYNLVRVGGTLGMRYQIGTGRQARGPDEALRTRRADCDELAMLFIAAARHLNISTNGISLATMDFHTSQPGNNPPVGHAVLLVRNGNNRQIFDFTSNAPVTVANFNQATIENHYRGNRIGYGPGRASYPIRSMANLRAYTNVSDMAAMQLLYQADYHNTQAVNTNNNTTKLRHYNSAQGYAQQAITLGSRHRHLITRIQQVSITIFDGYQVMGDNSHTAAKAARGRRRTAHYNRALNYYSRALQFYRNAPPLARTRLNAVVDIHENRGLIEQARGRHRSALREFGRMITLQPRGWRGYSRKMDLELLLARTAIRNRRRRTAHKYVRAAEKTGRTALANIPNTPAMAPHRTKIQNSLRGIRGYMQRNNVRPLP
jgi:hypothetical protein